MKIKWRARFRSIVRHSHDCPRISYVCACLGITNIKDLIFTEYEDIPYPTVDISTPFRPWGKQ